MPETPTEKRNVLLLPIQIEHPPTGGLVVRVVELLELERMERALGVARGLQAPVEGPADDPELIELRLQRLRGAALSRALIDLVSAGWRVHLEGGKDIIARSPDFQGAAAGDVAQQKKIKDQVRQAMSARVREQVQSSSTVNLVDEVENGPGGGVRAVIADGARLAQALARDGAEAVKPRLELARREDGLDPTSGVSRYALFRYLRFYWSFPFGDTPGRSLPILIRDDGQPGAPICGLLCLASPVLRLTARDDALGLTPAWLEAVVAGLDLPALPEDHAARRGALRAHFSALGVTLAAAREKRRGGPTFEQICEDLALLLNLGDVAPSALAPTLAALPPARLLAARDDAARRIASDLVQELRDAIGRIQLDGLNLTLDDALQAPEAHQEALRELGEQARKDWQALRGEEQRARAGVIGVNDEIRALRVESNEALFKKKRANQLAALLKAWEGARPLDVALREGASVMAALKAQALGAGLGEALLQRKVRIAASQIADVSLCGAIPPYNHLLGGKLAALLALSADAAQLYHQVYADRASTIQSRMSGEDVVRPTELLALTTTSFYEVGSAQYARLRLPAALGGFTWREVGRSRGNGSLHLSRETGELLSALLVAARGHKLITSTFGEGPSERLRKLREGLHELGLPADELLQHGMPRRVLVAPLSPLTRPGARGEAAAHHTRGPSAASIAAEWRSRWLTPRLEALLASDALQEASPDALLLSARFPEELRAARAEAAPARPPTAEETP
ncbi:MAG: DUF4338 domain-containing protein [Deltaproteobacteria bacterium]|nr:DUF4338 domain-containing protein [Deltaproteobacteria bacterium]